MASGKKLYTVKWPKANEYRLQSHSGVLVESNVQRQIALHFYNEARELEPEIQYQEDGQRMGVEREVAYIREITGTVLLAEASAIQLRDVLNTMFPPEQPDEMN